MDATLDVIAQEGWAGASTNKISALAKVSRGAQTHHFPTKSSLLLAALDRMTWLYEANVRGRMMSLPPSDRTLRSLLSILWDGFLDDRFNHSALEALVAARTEPDLRDAVADLDNRAIHAMRAIAADITSPIAPLEAMQDAVEMSVYYFRGLVVQRGLHNDQKYREQLFDAWCNMVEHSLSNRSSAV